MEKSTIKQIELWSDGTAQVFYNDGTNEIVPLEKVVDIGAEDYDGPSLADKAA